MKKVFSNKISIVFIVILLILIGALGYFGFKMLTEEDKTIVPDFSSATKDEVNAWCVGFDKNPCSFTLEYSDTVEENKVIYQSIVGGQEMGDSISFIISLGKKIEILVPTIDEKTTPKSIQEWATKNGLTKLNFIDQNSDTVEKGDVIKIEPQIIENKDTTINVYISNGKADKEKESEKKQDDSIEVESGKYIGLTVDEFKTKVNQLHLTPKYAESKDAYSSTVPKGNVVWHGSGSYVADEDIRYGISKGVNPNAITVYKGYLVNLTVDQFTSFVATLGSKGLTPVHNSDYDAYSSTIQKNLIVWHGSGDYEDGENISYGLCLGGPDEGFTVTYGTYLNKSEKEFISTVKGLSLVPNHNADRDGYIDGMEEGRIIWHGSGDYAMGETINYGLCIGKQGDSSKTTQIEIKEGDFVGKSFEEFKKSVEELGLVPYHRTNWDVQDFSKATNVICRNGYGTYEKGENISYGLYTGGSSEKTDDEHIEIRDGKYTGKTLDEFKTICESLGIKPEHSEAHSDDYSDTIAKGSILWHGSGTYDKNEVIHYTLSLGKKDSGGGQESGDKEKELYVASIGMYDAYVDSSYEKTRDNLESALKSQGFTNVTFVGEKAKADSVGVILGISVDGNSDYEPGYYKSNVAIVITICNATEA